MKVVRVQYTVRPEYAEQNKRNIEAVTRELRGRGRDDVKYAAYLRDDGKTFMHVGHFASPEAEGVLTGLESFRRFRTELGANLEVAPKAETFTLAHASWTIFPERADAA